MVGCRAVIGGFFLGIVGIGVFSCSESAREEVSPGNSFSIPANFPAPVYDFNRNPITKEGVELGRVLFNDPILSRDGSISCAKCHDQRRAFTDNGNVLSHGIEDRKGVRNSLPIQNLAWVSDFFWDGGAFDLDRTPLAPIQNSAEMDENPANLLEKLKKSGTYPGMFKRAFGSDEVTGERFVKALSQFMLTLVSANSRYDKFVRNEGETLTADELAGLSIFRQKCSTCHAGELFTDQSYRNNGLGIQGSKDEGRWRVTGIESDRFKFRVPSLRNVEVSGPYMHDGRFTTLESVMDHYSAGVFATLNLDRLLVNEGGRGISLTNEEKSKVVAFLKTLTDEKFITKH
jgi:cytochrome c peroxidase